jgi:hypothetical protein
MIIRKVMLLLLFCNGLLKAMEDSRVPSLVCLAGTTFIENGIETDMQTRVETQQGVVIDAILIANHLLQSRHNDAMQAKLNAICLQQNIERT